MLLATSAPVPSVMSRNHALRINLPMQISNSVPVDPAVMQATVENQIDVAVAQKAMQAQKQVGQAAVELIQDAVDIGQQLASGHIDVRL